VTRAEQFAALVSDVAREVVRRRSSDACCGDLTLEQYETLRTVSGEERATIGSLSKALGVDISTMSRNVSVLERARDRQRHPPQFDWPAGPYRVDPDETVALIEAAVRRVAGPS